MKTLGEMVREREQCEREEAERWDQLAIRLRPGIVALRVALQGLEGEEVELVISALNLLDHAVEHRDMGVLLQMTDGAWAM